MMRIHERKRTLRPHPWNAVGNKAPGPLKGTDCLW